MKKILIIYKSLPQYRLEFFNGLKQELEHKGIELTLVYGKNSSSKKKDEVDLSWGIYRENKVFVFGSSQLIWQPVWDLVKGKDLVIVEQANSLLINYPLMVLRNFGNLKFAFWGHGSNLQENSQSLKNRFKYLYLKQCDWWFAYTEGVKRFLESKGVESKRITTVNNAIDTRELMQAYGNISEDDVAALKRSMNIESEHIGIYCGALYSEKRIDFLIDAAILIRERIDDFHLIVVGAGEDGYIVEAASKQFQWLHYVGPKFGNDRVKYFKMAHLFLLPGAVGLAVLDAFAMQTPMITVENGKHGPEIEYLVSGVNGIVTKNDLESYVSDTVKCFLNPEMIQKMVSECKSSAEYFTVEAMVKNFSAGVYQCLR